MFGQVLVMRLFRDKGMLTQICGNNFMVLKVAPPLVVSEGQIEEFVEAVRDVVDLAHNSGRILERGPGTCTSRRQYLMTIMPYRILFFVTAVCAANAASPSATTLEQGYRKCTTCSSMRPTRHFRNGSASIPRMPWARPPMRPLICSANSTGSTFCNRNSSPRKIISITDHKLVPDPEVKKKFEADLNRAAHSGVASA